MNVCNICNIDTDLDPLTAMKIHGSFCKKGLSKEREQNTKFWSLLPLPWILLLCVQPQLGLSFSPALRDDDLPATARTPAGSWSVPSYIYSQQITRTMKSLIRSFVGPCFGFPSLAGVLVRVSRKGQDPQYRQARLVAENLVPVLKWRSSKQHETMKTFRFESNFGILRNKIMDTSWWKQRHRCH